MTPPRITLTEVTKLYTQGTSTVVALRDISLTIAPGECVAVMGSSGSGKSTLLNLIGCIDVPTHGSLRIGEQETRRLSDAELTQMRREQVGMIFQFFNLLGTLTAHQNVALPLLLARQSPKEAWRRADALLAAVGLKERRNHRPYELSGGEMQRVAVARALANDPAVLLADEPTGNLDSRTGGEILTLLTGYCREQGRTLLLATHDRDAAGRADRILHLRDGMLQ